MPSRFPACPSTYLRSASFQRMRPHEQRHHRRRTLLLIKYAIRTPALDNFTACVVLCVVCCVLCVVMLRFITQTCFPLTLTHSHTHTHTHSHTHSSLRLVSHSHSHTHTLSHTPSIAALLSFRPRLLAVMEFVRRFVPLGGLAASSVQSQLASMQSLHTLQWSQHKLL